MEHKTPKIETFQQTYNILLYMEENPKKTPQKILKERGNIIKTRDDYNLILVDSEGKVQNSEDCN